jgi:hypothetical protein
MRRIVALLLFAALIFGVNSLQRDSSAQDVVETAPVAATTYIAPPPPQQEIITEAPSPSYVWVAGHWNRTPDDWQWVSGQWVQPPFSNAYWVPGYWQHQSGQYMWEPAHWAATAQGVVVAKPIAAPPLYKEAKPAPPASNTLVWQPGHWEWRGTWVWIPGVYIESTTPKAVWVQGQWITGPDGNWCWSPAHWAVG